MTKNVTVNQPKSGSLAGDTRILARGFMDERSKEQMSDKLQFVA
jgi:hypothetical protein